MSRAYSRKKIDLTGQRFGRLTVVAPAENIGNRTAWLCQCDCGNEIVAKTAHLRAGKVKSCGCIRAGSSSKPEGSSADTNVKKLPGRKRLDLTGQKFGLLTVLNPAENIGEDTAWLCRCDCGKERIIRTMSLRSGNTRSCGKCLHASEKVGDPTGISRLTMVDGTCVEMIRANTLRSNNTSGVVGVEWRKKTSVGAHPSCLRENGITSDNMSVSMMP